MKTIEQIALEVMQDTDRHFADTSVTMNNNAWPIKFAEKFLTAWLDQQSQEPVAWYSHSGTLAYDKKSFPPSTRHLAKPLFLAPQPTIPEGYVLVPKEPSEAMKEAAATHYTSDDYTGFTSTYHAMLKAAQGEQE